MLQDQRQHAPIVPHKLLPHDRLIPDTVLGVTGFGLGHEIVEGGFLAPQEGMCDITPFSLSYCYVNSYPLPRGKGEISAVGKNR